MQTGIYEQLITTLFEKKLQKYESSYYIKKQQIDTHEAAIYLSRYLTQILKVALDSFPISDEQRIEKQIKLSNSLILWLSNELEESTFHENLLDTSGELLKALYSTENPVAQDLKKYVAKITPITGLTQSELFTGSNTGISLESEIKREIQSSDEINWLVSFIKWTGIRIFSQELKDFAETGKRIKIITTSYMGATDQKAVDFLSSLQNCEVKLSYNCDNERLHAKTYIFKRNTGFHTAYIGSSNISRSALTNGLEWNLKVTTKEIPHIIDKFNSTFETYWSSSEFETYNHKDPVHHEKLSHSLKKGKGEEIIGTETFFDLKPHIHQKEILERLRIEREIHNRYRNLVVAATGTGKTVISAFDFKNYYKENREAKLLFVAHKVEILKQARNTFRAVLRNPSFGELWVDREIPDHHRQLFVSVQTFNSQKESIALLSREFYDFIIIDEVHHIAAKSYRPILDTFEPEILLGLTATPERMDDANILDDFCGTIAAELRLADAINQRHLCPFQYFGIEDTTDISNVKWINGQYAKSELTNVYTDDRQRVDHILRNMDDILDNIHNSKALGYCVTKAHAQYMSDQFNQKGIRADVLTSDNSVERETLRNKLVRGYINVLFVVDIFNEGVDIPEVDTLLFLRPTESLTIFLQQLGRGLRLSDNKDCLTVLDFVGNGNSQYDYSSKMKALIGKNQRSTVDDVQNNFPQLPLGCSIQLQKQVKERILYNIRNAIINKRKLIHLIQNYRHNTEMDLNVGNFLKVNPQVRLDDVYKTGWNQLCFQANISSVSRNATLAEVYRKAIANRFLTCKSRSYLKFVAKLISNDFTWDQSTEIENQMALMAYYDFWNKPGKDEGFETISDGFKALQDESLKKECLEVLLLILGDLETSEMPMKLGAEIALQIHGRYSRDQILAAFGEHSFEKRSSSREGVILIENLNIELLFVTLNKLEKHYSPTTLYNDYAINEYLFHWQSQNSARPDKGKGLSYINHEDTGKKILLFVREQNKDEYGRTISYVNLGEVYFRSTYGQQPMNITWELQEPLPPYLWDEAAKLSVG
ncbi:DUF3427 domain-containing protein [Spirochaeta isovalerica]|uniref:Superfamily II DNA or RNA helicase n=1 Tax=Spirochaeta isovalerica TaxID=150 RepID=A0A841RF76_9SPIO|nr:DEAD/DEAH box helicase [Spirochaeta isovalerica]MBB6481867.1 superfamily II DNA or RNA helicase [Spirochaeta isovalerica]